MTSTRPTRNFDLIVFDWDGTLYDSTALIVHCIQAACEDIGLGRPANTDAAYVIGLGLYEALARVAPGATKEQVGELVQRYRHHYFASQHELTLFPGVLEMLADLRTRGHALAVATGKSRQGLNEALGHVELRHMFDATRTADETASKPHPQMLLELMEELATPPERTLMIGDTTHDLLLASNAGAASLGVSYGAHEPAEFAVHGPRHIAHTVTELRDWLLTHG